MPNPLPCTYQTLFHAPYSKNPCSIYTFILVLNRFALQFKKHTFVTSKLGYNNV